MNERREKPTLEELRSIITSVKPSGEFNITPSVEKAIPTPIFFEDSDQALRLQANDAFNNEMDKHPELTTKVARLGFIKDNLKYDDFRLSQFLGITLNQVQRKDLRGRKKKEINRFEQRFKDLFTITSILTTHFSGYIGATMDRKISLETPNGKLSNISVSDAIKEGYTSIAVAIALETVRLNQESMDYQKDYQKENTFLSD